MDLITLCSRAKIAKNSLLSASEETINGVLTRAGDLLIENSAFLIEQNKIDIEYAKSLNKSDGFIDRLTLNEKVISGMAEGLKQVSLLKSPIGEEVYSYNNDYQGISVKKINVPFGVIGIIFESRPNVTADAFALCFKTRNAVVLKGGSDAINSNLAIAKVIRQAISEFGLDENALSVIPSTDRETVKEFMRLNKYIDLLIPRGSASLINSALENSTIPIIETGTGNCHVYVEKTADIEKSVEVIFNAKTQRYSVCNACESLVIDSDILDKVLPKIYDKLLTKQVEMRCDDASYKVLQGKPLVVKATDEDFYTEYGGPIISVKTVDGVLEAINHINEHSTGHSESIMTNDIEKARLFQKMIDSSSVYVNCSTRFTDGFVFGLGAEIGISTQKLHARGPMGLNALVTTKYLIDGDGAIRK